MARSNIDAERLGRVADMLSEMGPKARMFVLKRLLGSNKQLMEALAKELKKEMDKNSNIKTKEDPQGPEAQTPLSKFLAGRCRYTIAEYEAAKAAAEPTDRPPADLRLGSDTVMAALKVAADLHAGHLRGDGETPYILHPFRVAGLVQGAGFGNTLTAVALLHDALEEDNTPSHGQVTADGLTEMLLAEGVCVGDAMSVVKLGGVRSLTRGPGDIYAPYLGEIIDRGMGTAAVKFADILDNSHPTREGGCPGSLLHGRYLPSLRRLDAAFPGLARRFGATIRVSEGKICLTR